jgi:hypothetical protein
MLAAAIAATGFPPSHFPLAEAPELQGTSGLQLIVKFASSRPGAID